MSTSNKQFYVVEIIVNLFLLLSQFFEIVTNCYKRIVLLSICFRILTNTFMGRYVYEFGVYEPATLLYC